MFKIAEIENNIVTNVIIANNLKDLPNTRTFVIVTNLTGEAFINSAYDSSNNIFIIPSPYPSWLFNYTTKQWEAPIPKPSENDEIPYQWNEANTSWIVGNTNYIDTINFLVEELDISTETSNNASEVPLFVPSLNVSFITENHPGINENTKITYGDGIIVMMNLTPPQ